jgi:hypothetical protein
MVRWLVDAYTRRRHAGKDLTEEQMVAETDKSPGVLLASGYIAGGALAGIVIALLAGAMKPLDDALNAWATDHNPVFNGPYADALSMLFFLGLCAFLYFVGREKILVPRRPPPG